MTRVASEKQYNSFVKGLITEASPLTFPENAFLDGDNIVLNKDGSFARRLGIEYEPDYRLINPGLGVGYTLGFYRWDFAGNDPHSYLGIIRARWNLYFVDLLQASPSNHLKNNGAGLYIPGLNNGTLEVTRVNGGVVLVSSDLASPVYLTYNPTTDTVTRSDISLKVRDFWGVVDGERVDVRPSTLSDTHKYNLMNQGWSETNMNLVDYPSNADIWTLGKDTSDDFSKATLLKNSTDTAPAPKGKYIIDIYDRGSSRIAESYLRLNTGSPALVLPDDTESGRIQLVATYAGRVFYAGIDSKVTNGDTKSPDYGGCIFFSKTVSNKEDLGICYQEADPTSEYISDIIDTDGGYINILGANKIVKLVAATNSLVVFAGNGAWRIYGSDSGFKATDYQVEKITNVGVTDGRSVVVAGDNIFYWSRDGIYIMTQDNVSGQRIVQNLSLTTIQSFYNNLSTSARHNAKGMYDERANTVRWLYSNESETEYDKELILDITLQAFYTNSIETTTDYIVDYVTLPNFVENINEVDIYADFDPVYVNTDMVVAEVYIPENRDTQFSFLTYNRATYSWTISRYSNSGFLDWTTIDYSSYIITGHELFSDFMRKKQATYLMMMLERTETGFNIEDSYLVTENPSSCFVQSQWNWTDSAASGKWGTPFQAYRYTRPYNPSGANDLYETGDRVLVTKNKLRGSGRALSLYIYSETGKDMKVYGFALPVTGNSKV